MIKKIENSDLRVFIEYCRVFGPEHDSSYLPSDEFVADENHPSVMLSREDGSLVGAASLILEDHYRKARKGRFMIFHSVTSQVEVYRSLLDAIIGMISEIDEVYLFVSPEQPIQSILEEIGFSLERYSFILKRKQERVSLEIPEEIHFIDFDPETHGEIYCNIINSAFAEIAGHLDINQEWLRRFLLKSNVPRSGIQLLIKVNEPIGLLFSEVNEDGLLEIGPLAVLPSFQGQGYGRLLLRKALLLSLDLGLESILSVNAENEKALSLYIEEGFEKAWTKACYRFAL